MSRALDPLTRDVLRLARTHHARPLTEKLWWLRFHECLACGLVRFSDNRIALTEDGTRILEASERGQS